MHPKPSRAVAAVVLAAAVLVALLTTTVPSAEAGRFMAKRIEIAHRPHNACVARAARRARVARRRHAHRRDLSRRARAAIVRRCRAGAQRRTGPAAKKARRPARKSPASSPTPTPSPAPAPPSAGPAGLTATALDAGSVTLAWTPPPGAASIQIVRDGRTVDTLAGDAAAFTDRGLWEQTHYAYSVRFLDPAGRALGEEAADAMTPQRDGFARLYANDAFVNRPIGAGPALDGNSAAIVQRALVAYRNSANFTNTDDWAIPIVSSDASTRRYDVRCEIYWCNLDFGAFAIPSSAEPSHGGDHHLAVIDSGGSEMDMWVARHQTDGWSAGTRWRTRADGSGVNCDPGQHCGGADAANFALAAGVVRPEEIAQGHIDHALMITTPFTRAGVKACPATGTDGRNADPAALPLGARVQLDPSLDVSALNLPGWQRTVARALQVYGAYVVDTGGSLAVRAESNLGRGYDAWSRAGVPDGAPGLRDLPWERMRVLRYSAC